MCIVVLVWSRYASSLCVYYQPMPLSSKLLHSFLHRRRVKRPRDGSPVATRETDMNIAHKLYRTVRTQLQDCRYYFSLPSPLQWILDHAVHRYHVVDLRSKFYSGGWVDTDFRILYACFELLRQFVEEENGLEFLRSPEHDSHSTEVLELDKIYMEVEQLYTWWTVERSTKGQDSKSRCRQDSEYLDRLMKVRRHLWT